MRGTALLGDKPESLRDVLALFWIALGLRVTYLILAATNLGMDRFATYAPDSRTYMAVADQIMHGVPMGDYWLLRVGPGYASILVTLRTIFGDTPLAPILLNVLLGALAPVIIYLLAEHLLKHRPVSLIAGAIAAISWTSISLSTHILTDQPAYTTQAAALLFFVIGMRTGRLRWFVATGIVAGISAYIRPTGQFWPLIFVFIAAVVPVARTMGSRWRQVRLAGVSALIIVVMIMAWSTRNYVVHDQFTFGTNGVYTVRSCLIVKAVVDNTDEGPIMELRNRWHDEDGEFGENWPESFDKAMGHIREVTTEHPGWVAKAFFQSIEDNIKARNYYAERQITQFETLFKFINNQIFNWWAHVLLALTLIGLIWMMIQRRPLAWLLLGITYFFYTLLTGLSYWQGSRLHFPAEMAWAILVAFAVYKIGATIRQRLAAS